MRLKNVLLGRMSIVDAFTKPQTVEELRAKEQKKKEKAKNKFVLDQHKYREGLISKAPSLSAYGLSEMDFNADRVKEEFHQDDRILQQRAIDEARREKQRLESEQKSLKKTFTKEYAKATAQQEQRPIKKEEAIEDVEIVETETREQKEVYIPQKKNLPQGKKVTLNARTLKSIQDVLHAYKVKFKGTPNVGGGHRKATYTIKLENGTIAKVKRNLVDIALEVGADSRIGSVIPTIEQGGLLKLEFTYKEFDPIYTENVFSYLKKEGDYILGEMIDNMGQAQILVRNIFSQAPVHLAFSGGTGSGKSFTINALIQSLLSSTPNGSYYLYSPKSDAHGGDFSSFAKYPQAKECNVIGNTPTAHREMLEQVLAISQKLIDLITAGGDGTPHFLVIDELAYLCDAKEIPKRPTKQDLEEGNEWMQEEYDTYTLKKRVLKNLKTIAQLGRSPRVILILGTQMFSSMSFDSQLISNLTRVSLKMGKGFGQSTPFNKHAEKLLPKGDGLIEIDGEFVSFQATLATP